MAGGVGDKTLKRNLILLGVALLLIILTALQELHFDNAAKEEGKLFSFLINDVHTIKMNAAEEYSLIKRNGLWHSETHDSPANDEEVEDLLKTLSETEKEDTIENVSNKEAYGLAGETTRSFEILGENITLRLRIGGTNPGDKYYYADFGPTYETVYLLDKWDTDRVFKSWADIRQKKPLYAYDPSSLDSFSYQISNRIVLSAKKAADGGFTLIIPSGKILNEENWDDFMEKLFDFEIGEFRENSISEERVAALKKDAGYLLDFRFDGGEVGYLGVSVDKADEDQILIFSSFLKGLGEKTAYWKSDIEFDPEELFEEPTAEANDETESDDDSQDIEESEDGA